MLDTAAPNRPNPAPATAFGLAPGADPGLALQLPADAYWQLVHTLRLALPPPLSDRPEDLRRRDHAAVACIAGLCPANAAEAELAAQFVAASEQWKYCLRLAQLLETTPDAVSAQSADFAGRPDWAAKCRAQAMAMMRQSLSALRLLLRLQEARRKQEADHATADRMAWSEHCALGLMAEALGSPPTPAMSRSAPLAPPASPPIAEPPVGAPQAAPQPAAHAPGPSPDAAPEPARTSPAEARRLAEQYAVLYPERAVLIRRLGRLPDDMSFGPPDEDLVAALLGAPDPAGFDAPNPHPLAA